MSSSSKRQQTAAKRSREHAVRERRELKAEKKLVRKQAAEDARIAEAAAGTDAEPQDGDGVTSSATPTDST